MLRFKVIGDKEKVRDLKNFRRHAGVLDRPFRQIAEIIRAMWDKQFGREGAYNHPKWRSLKESTKRQRLRMGFAEGPILFRTGSLMRSFSTKGKGHYAVVGPKSLTIGSKLTVPKGGHTLAAIHQYGAGVPRRSFVGVDTGLPVREDEKARAIITEYIDQWWTKHG